MLSVSCYVEKHAHFPTLSQSFLLAGINFPACSKFDVILSPVEEIITGKPVKLRMDVKPTLIILKQISMRSIWSGQCQFDESDLTNDSYETTGLQGHISLIWSAFNLNERPDGGRGMCDAIVCLTAAAQINKRDQTRNIFIPIMTLNCDRCKTTNNHQ